VKIFWTVSILTLAAHCAAQVVVIDPPTIVVPPVFIGPPTIIAPMPVDPPTNLAPVAVPKSSFSPAEVSDTDTLSRLIASDQTPTGARLTNVSVLARLKLTVPLSMGFVMGGTSQRTVLIRAIGGGLREFGVSDTAVIPLLSMSDGAGRKILSQAGTFTAAAIAARNRLGAWSEGLHDTAAVMTLPPGAYTITVSDLTFGYPLEFGLGLDLPRVDGLVLAEVYDIAGGADSRLTNCSSLGGSTPGEGGAIAGFVIGGIGSRRLLVRGIGPSLTQFGVSSPAAAPTFIVRDSRGISLATGEGPQPADAAAMAARVGAFPVPTSGRDTALGLTLAPGAYTVQINPGNDSAAPALLELYEDTL
jgi:hypothetical protein